jgi:ABC-type uncharacterized transport system permease subunit
MLATALSVVAMIAWSATAAVAVADMFGDGPRTGRVSRAGLFSAVLFTGAAASAIVSDSGIEGLLGPPGRFAFLALSIGIGALVLVRRLPMRATVALVAPLGAVLLAAYLLAPEHMPEKHDTELFPLLLVHIGLVLVGVGTFALAAAASSLYLVQERQIRRREFGKLFHKLPSLEELDAASFRLVLWGFVVYTVALAFGFAWTAQTEADAANFRVLLALVAWGTFAAVIHTRVTTGWRGRQAAKMTIAACVATFIVLAGYVIR